eukprot:6001214-Ditylum_brightwellii.AAC.1
MNGQHVWQLMGTLGVSDVDVEYWISALNSGRVTIVTSGSVAQKTGAELTGILSALYLLCALSQYSGNPIITKQQVYCDNMAAVTCLNTSIRP